MPFALTMPKLSPTMEEGTIVKWHKKEGDFVKDGELLFEVATDKATVEHQAIDEGYLRKILIPEGSQAKVNQNVAIFSASKDDDIESFLKEEKPKEEKPKSTDQKEEKKEPQQTAAPQMLQPAFEPPPPLQHYEFQSSSSQIKASPLAKKLAKEKHLSLSGLKGSGPGGRIVAKDLENAQNQSIVAHTQGEKPSLPPGSFRSLPLTQMRKTIGDRLQASKTFIPHFYVQQEINAQKLVMMRGELKEEGIHLTFNDFVVRAVALALREMPEINRGFNSKDQTITEYLTVDISIAVSIAEGLITPIVRHADFKNIIDIAQEIKSLVKTAKEGKLKPEQFIGGSFTVSNLGMYGIKDFQAVINPPQGAILAVGGILDKPIIQEDTIIKGKIMNLSLSVDHRVIDGALAAEFINLVKRLLEKPFLLVM